MMKNIAIPFLASAHRIYLLFEITKMFSSIECDECNMRISY